MKKFLVAIFLTLAVASSAVLLSSIVTSEAATPPPAFTDIELGNGFFRGRQLVPTPDGRMFLLEAEGRIRVLKDDVFKGLPLIQITTVVDNGHGLMSIALDDDFENNGHFFALYSINRADGVRTFRLSRFTAVGDVAAPASEVILSEDFPDYSATGLHLGGAMVVGPDAKLYITTGDGVQGAVSQQLDNIYGKVLRLNKDGSIPTDNPFYNQTTGINRAIYAYGLRNPFSFSDPQPGTNRIFIGDVGEASWEELNELAAGANYGWNNTEGVGGDPAETDPVYAYPHPGVAPGPVEGCAVGGGAFYNPDVVQFPQSYVGDYFFVDVCFGWISHLDLQTGEASIFSTDAVNLVDVAINPVTGALYYLDRDMNGSDRTGVGRIDFVDQEVFFISSQPRDASLAIGQTASFSTSAGGPDNITYQWQRNGVMIPGATSPTYSLPSITQADDGAVFRAVISSGGETLVTRNANLTVSDNFAPSATINEPPPGTLYRAGDTISFSATATDPEDGVLTGASLTWEARLNHNIHDHNFYGPFTGNDSGQITLPVIDEVDQDVWYTFYLTATDSEGTSTTVTRRIDPRKSQFTLATEPPGLDVRLDGLVRQTPAQIIGVERIQRQIAAPATQTKDGVDYEFVSWSDGGARDHSISTPLEDTTYTATYREVGMGAPACTGTRDGDTVTLSFSGDLPSGRNLLRNGQWLVTVSNQAGYVDANAPAGATYVLRLNVLNLDVPCSIAPIGSSTCSALLLADSEVVLSWDAVPGASAYVAYRNPDNTQRFWRGRVDAPATTVTDLINDARTYAYDVEARAADNSVLETITCSPDLVRGDPEPSTCAASLAGTDVTLSWDPVGGATAYVAYRNPDNTQRFWRGRVDAPATTFADSITDERTYVYDVEARDANNAVIETIVCSPELPDGGGNPTCSAVLNGATATVSWDAVPGATGYVVFRNPNDTQRFWRGRVEAPATTFDDTITDGRSYAFDVEVRDANNVTTQTISCQPNLQQ